MEFKIDNLPQAIQSTKKLLRRELPNYAEVFRQVEAEMRRRVDVIVKERESGQGGHTHRAVCRRGLRAVSRSCLRR